MHEVYNNNSSGAEALLLACCTATVELFSTLAANAPSALWPLAYCWYHSHCHQLIFLLLAYLVQVQYCKLGQKVGLVVITRKLRRLEAYYDSTCPPPPKESFPFAWKPVNQQLMAVLLRQQLYTNLTTTKSKLELTRKVKKGLILINTIHKVDNIIYIIWHRWRNVGLPFVGRI